MSNEVYRLKINLSDMEQPVWRQIQVPGDISFKDLHKAIQILFDWEGYHMYDFRQGKTVIAEKDEFDSMQGGVKKSDPKKTKLSAILKGKGDKIIYTYDFGDDWQHIIEVEEVEQGEEGGVVCLAGERNAPPEDCGGAPGYAYMQEVLSNPDHEEYEDYKEEDTGHDPEYFNLDELNGKLAKAFPVSRK
jgi:hypothetical protein